MSLDWFRQHSIAKDCIKLIGSSSLAQFVSILLLTVVGRLYNEAQMGTIGLFLSWGGFLAIAAGGRYEHAIVVAGREDEAKHLFHLSLLFNFSAFALLLLPTLLLNELIQHSSYAELNGYLLLLPLFVLLQSSYNSFSMYRLRQKAYTTLSFAQGGLGIANSLGRVILGFFSPTVWSLVASSLMSLLVGLAPLCQRPLLPKTLRISDRSDLKRVASKYRKFPCYGVPQSMIDTLLGSILVMMMPMGFSFAQIGIVTMAVMLAKRPLQIIGDNLSKVYFQRLSHDVAQGLSIRPRVGQLIRIWLCIALPVAFVLPFVLKPAVTLLVGAKWEQSAYVISWMLPMLIPNFLAAVLNILPDIFGRQRLNMYAQLLMLLFELAVLLIGLSCLDFNQFVPFYFLCIAVGQAAYLILLLRLVGRYEATL
ncbi:MAG: oligosaccharide flippase family protein [Porphyromonas sp.]|nr:oligosaccharide flippase family protein [Porphyromonas sp.]